MTFSKEEIRDLSLDQLTDDQLMDAEESLNGFASLFGKNWVLKYFGSAKATVFVLRLTSAWQDWKLVNNLEGAADLAAKWKAGFTEHGVLLEVQVAAALIRVNAEVQLFPSVGFRFADFRFRMPTIHVGWIYVEVSKRGMSEVMENAQHLLQKVANAAVSAMPKRHGKVALLRFLSEDETSELITWIGTLPDDGDRTRFKDYAYFVADPIETPADGEPNIFDEITPPKFYCTTLKSADGYLQKGTAGIQVTDDAAERILRSESEQLPKSGPGIIILDLTSVPGGLKDWGTLVAMRLQPNLNRRINAVILVTDLGTTKGPEPSTRVIEHPNPRNPFPNEIITKIKVELAK